MKKVLSILLLAALLAGGARAQSPAERFARIEASIKNQHYADAYKAADNVREEALRRASAEGATDSLSRALLASTWYMEVAAVNYQEDARESSLARLRGILPYLTVVDRSLCYLMLDLTDSALVDTLALRGIAGSRLAPFFTLPDAERYVDVTPTAYDALVHMAAERAEAERRTQLLQGLLRWRRTLPATGENVAPLVFCERAYARSLAQRPNTPFAKQCAIYQGCLNRCRHLDDAQVALLYNDLALLHYEQARYTAALAYCDSAIGRYPKSQGGADCANLKERILAKWVEVELDDNHPAGRDILCRVQTRNVDTLYCRVVDASKMPHKYLPEEQMRKYLLGCKTLESWCEPLQVEPDHRQYEHYAYLPALPGGSYALLVSPTPDFGTAGFCMKGFAVYAAAFVRTRDVHEGYLVDYVTGAPIAGQKVRLQRSRNYGRDYRTLATTVTDKQGFYRFADDLAEGYGAEYRVQTLYGGMEIASEGSCGAEDEDTLRSGYQVFLDRPVYRPGDTVQLLVVESEVRRNRQGRTIGGDSLRVVLRDVNRQPADSLVGVTDAYGSISGRLKIPAQALPGQFYLELFGHRADGKWVRRSSENVRVEAYKQPKFAVTLKSAGRCNGQGQSIQPTLGDSLAVDGLAASYSQVPVAGARVGYSVERRLLRPWWRQRYGSQESAPAVVAADSTLTDAEGHFRIAFVANPDSTVELSERPCFVYTVRVEVTDLDGQTHSQSLSLRLGYENSYIAIAGPEEKQVWEAVEYQYCDLNGTPLQGEVSLTVERLRQPQRLWLKDEAMNEKARHTLTEAEFRRRFPYTPYSYEEAQMAQWPAEEVVYKTRQHCGGESSNRAPLPELVAGVYRVSVSCGDASNQAVVVYTPPEARKVQTMDLLWADQSHSQARVGDTVSVRIGTRHRGVTAVCQLWHGRQELDRRLLRIEDSIATLRIPVTERMLGGLDVHLYAVKEGRAVAEQVHVEVAFAHKQLAVEFATFRDRLAPGERESWTLNLKRKADTAGGGQPAAVGSSAAMLLAMYDASLDSYGAQSYLWWPWRKVVADGPNGVRFSTPYYLLRQSNLLVESAQHVSPQGKGVACSEFTALRHRGWQWRNGGSEPIYAWEESASSHRRMLAKGNRVALCAVESANEVADLDVAEEAAVMYEAMVEEVEAESDPNEIGNAPDAPEEPHIRTNLGTLAFFEPTLRTRPDGTVSYSFVVPDNLTRWNVKGVAWTQDLAIGQVERSLITQKQLMVQPNMPRFLREGDTATLLAKVTNLTDSDMVARVDFCFDIPATGCLPQQHQGAGCEVHLPARGSAQVEFTVVAVVGGTVATYRYTARSGRYSDGEQGPLPLLTNRQAVTRSVSMFMNGKGERDYTLRLPASASAQPVSFTVEYTANPAWLAIEALPYMAQCANPSNIYFFNSYYVNTLGRAIAQGYPELKHCADSATEEASPLLRGAEVRQTLLDETPWLGEGTGEVEQLKAIAAFYNDEALQRQADEATSKLQKAQRSDGSWPWMPDGNCGSTYVTQYLLRGLGDLSHRGQRQPSRMESRALDYVDQAAYETYLEWLKYLKKHPGSQCQPIMLDYLYTRSYFPDRALSATRQKAYDFYYTNAKEHYGDYTSLYDQALLALVFHRRGDTELALEMVTRIKQKALYDNEVGMYWRDNKAGRFYYQRPIETQALLIETLREVMPGDTLSIGRMQQWLLKQKQTTRWSTDVATLRAIQALMPTDTATRGTFGRLEEADRIVVSGAGLADTLTTPVGNSGYLRRTYRADSLTDIGSGGQIDATVLRPGKGISWGGLFYRYTERMDKVSASETGIQMTRRFYRVGADGALTEVTPEGRTQLQVGDRLRVVLSLRCDRNLEYVQVKNFRAACLEPVGTASGWRHTQGLSYYVVVNNSHDAIYIDRLDKGRYTIESTYYLTNPGTFTLAPTVVQCLYAPEFRSTTSGTRITVR